MRVLCLEQSALTSLTASFQYLFGTVKEGGDGDRPAHVVAPPVPQELGRLRGALLPPLELEGDGAPSEAWVANRMGQIFERS